MGYYDNRLRLYADIYSENSFIGMTSNGTFARINFINGKWVVWYYTKHLQKTFRKIKEALKDMNSEFIAWYRMRKN